jgi:hypothetical protein
VVAWRAVREIAMAEEPMEIVDSSSLADADWAKIDELFTGEPMTETIALSLRASKTTK